MLRILRPPGRACASPGSKDIKDCKDIKDEGYRPDWGFLVLAVLAVLYVLASQS